MNSLKQHINTIAFDADDTLWVNETNFKFVEKEVSKLLLPYLEKDILQTKLYETERKNLQIFGYGAKGFALSLIETAIELSLGAISGKEIHTIIDLIKKMLAKPIEILEGIEEVLDELSHHYQLMIITKGDLFDQETKVARSGLVKYFDNVEIVSEKAPVIYQNILDKYGIKREQFLMIGNSLKSDVLPVCQIGAHAIHIPFHTTWELEKITPAKANGHQYYTLQNVRELIPILK